MWDKLIILPILFPMICGAVFSFLPIKSSKGRNIFIETVVIINAILAIVVLLNRPSELVVIYKMTNKLSLELNIDRMSVVFAGLVTLLWPFATLYAFEYMSGHEHRKKAFFSFYTMTFGITLGVAFAGNLETMYLFYELLTLVTLPLVMHEMNMKSIRAARVYMVYSIAGAAFAFISIIFILNYGDTTSFIFGGVLNHLPKDKEELMRLWYVFAFFGFGVKAAVFPMHGWLPKASVAPTPVTALLHAVAVVKSGAFAIGRITYYSYGSNFLKGSWAQYVVMGAAITTIIFGSSMAIKEPQIKRRLAYSTISNLSYILFGFTLMTSGGVVGALSHMVFHGIMKIILFMCAGAIMVRSKKEYVGDLIGIGKKMPRTISYFTLVALALIGVPFLPGFISKWYLVSAAINANTVMSYIGMGALFISAFFTAIYLLSISIRGIVVTTDFDDSKFEDVTDPGLLMRIPLFVLSIVVILLGINSGPLIDFLLGICQGL